MMTAPSFALLLLLLPCVVCADPILLTSGASSVASDGSRSLLQAPSWHPANSARRGDRPNNFDPAEAATTSAVTTKTPAATAVVDADDDIPAVGLYKMHPVDP